jgi:hypothetical protein
VASSCIYNWYPPPIQTLLINGHHSSKATVLPEQHNFQVGVASPTRFRFSCQVLEKGKVNEIQSASNHIVNKYSIKHFPLRNVKSNSPIFRSSNHEFCCTQQRWDFPVSKTGSLLPSYCRYSTCRMLSPGGCRRGGQGLCHIMTRCSPSPE